jgi:hypothetical protein
MTTQAELDRLFDAMTAADVAAEYRGYEDKYFNARHDEAAAAYDAAYAEFVASQADPWDRGEDDESPWDTGDTIADFLAGTGRV